MISGPSKRRKFGVYTSEKLFFSSYNFNIDFYCKFVSLSFIGISSSGFKVRPPVARSKYRTNDYSCESNKIIDYGV